MCLPASILRNMTGPTTACADGTAAEPGELRDNLRRADPGVLVAILAQLTGDASVVDTFGPKISHVPDPPERAGVTDPATAEVLIDAV
ncbi:MAG: 4-hydroxyacetophenone monooxygenase, partial [Mycobacterium sp.]|nr:4-hydroxyacetophenone monooxygenase [Mycobacterium sp.]